MTTDLGFYAYIPERPKESGFTILFEVDTGYEIVVCDKACVNCALKKPPGQGGRVQSE